MNHVRYQSARVWLWLCLLALAPFQVNAQSTDRISAAEFGRLWGPALDPAGATQVRNYPVGPSYPVTATPVIAAETGGALSVSKSARFPVDSSRVIDVTAKAAVSKAAMGKALRGAVSLLGGPVGVALFAAAEIADWMAQSGLRQSPTSPGVIERTTPGTCTVAPCYDYSISGGSSGATPWRSSLEMACADTMVDKNTRFPAYTFTYLSVTYASNSCSYYMATKPNGANVLQNDTYQVRSRSPDTNPVYQVATPSEIESLASAPTMKPDWLKRVLDSGVTVDAANPTLTGPSSVAGPSTTSSEAIKDATGVTTGTRTVTNSSTYNVTYNGNTYNVNQVTTITTVNPDGTSTVKTQTDSKAPDKPQPTDCDKVPDSAGCVSLGSPTSDTFNKKTSAVSVVAATFASSSACPAPLSFTVRGSSYGVSYQPLCDRLAILRVLFLAIAGVIAALILAETFKV